jgi:hypothetical protein
VLNHTRNQIETLIKKVYGESKLQELLRVESTTHSKIILALLQQSMKYDLISFGEHQQPREIPVNHPGFKALAFALNLVLFIYSILKYCFVPFLYRLIVGKYSPDFNDRSDLRFVFINSAGGKDRLTSIIREDFHETQYLMFHLFTSFPRKIFERLKKKPHIKFISPQLPHKKAIYKCLVFLFRNGHVFTSHVYRSFCHYPVSLRLKIASTLTQYIYALLIIHPWAQQNASKMAMAYPKALFVFDLDEAGKELMLADCLNQLGKKSLLIQHGALTNAKRYIPTCSFMACTSERGRRSLISEGVDPKRLYKVGQALQTINDSIWIPKEEGVSYPILVLAGVGPIWLQNLYVNMLKRIRCPEENRPVYLRFHPAMGLKNKKLWNYTPSIKVTDAGESLGESISKAKLIVTFSLDALLVSVRQHRPTIVCIPEKIFVPAWHNFMLSLPMVRVVKNSELLDDALMDPGFRNLVKNHFSDKQWQYVDYAFGELNTKKNFKCLLPKLVEKSVL